MPAHASRRLPPIRLAGGASARGDSRPTPAAREVLVRVHSASVNAADRVLLRGKPFLVRLGIGPLKPRRPVLGFDLSGRVESVGKGVSQFRPNDEVFGASNSARSPSTPACRKTLSSQSPRTCRSSRRLRRRRRHTLRCKACETRAGYAQGSGAHRRRLRRSGTFAIQIAKAFGAEVTAVCSTRNVDIARLIGADHVIDYRREDFVAAGGNTT